MFLFSSTFFRWKSFHTHKKRLEIFFKFKLWRQIQLLFYCVVKAWEGRFPRAKRLPVQQCMYHYGQSKHISFNIRFLFCQFFGFWPTFWILPLNTQFAAGWHHALCLDQVFKDRFGFIQLVFSRKSLWMITYPTWQKAVVLAFQPRNNFLNFTIVLSYFCSRWSWKDLFFESKGFRRPYSTFVTYFPFFFFSELHFKWFFWAPTFSSYK